MSLHSNESTYDFYCVNSQILTTKPCIATSQVRNISTTIGNVSTTNKIDNLTCVDYHQTVFLVKT